MRLKAIELARLTQVVRDPRRFMALGAIEGKQIRRSTRVVREPRRFMALGAIEGNRTHLFDSCGA